MSTALLVGNTVDVLVNYAKEHLIDLIVVCSHGNTGMKRWVQGSFAQYLLRQSPIPVLIIRHGHAMERKSQEKQPHAFHILVALDGSMLAETAILPAAWLSSILSAPATGRLHLLRVVRPTYFVHEYAEDIIQNMNEEVVEQARIYLMNIERLIQRSELKELHLEVTSAVALHVDVAHTLLYTAANGEWEDHQQISKGYDAIALATHGRTGLQHLIEGSIAEQLLGKTTVPLLVLSHTQHIST
jgi:nucleotide-binding universal stress UspA family protein